MLFQKVTPILEMKKTRLGGVMYPTWGPALVDGQVRLLGACLMPTPTCTCMPAGPMPGTVLDPEDAVTTKTQGNESWNLRSLCSEVRLTAEQALYCPFKATKASRC